MSVCVIIKRKFEDNLKHFVTSGDLLKLNKDVNNVKKLRESNVIELGGKTDKQRNVVGFLSHSSFFH